MQERTNFFLKLVNRRYFSNLLRVHPSPGSVCSLFFFLSIKGKANVCSSFGLALHPEIMRSGGQTNLRCSRGRKLIHLHVLLLSLPVEVVSSNGIWHFSCTENKQSVSSKNSLSSDPGVNRSCVGDTFRVEHWFKELPDPYLVSRLSEYNLRLQYYMPPVHTSVQVLCGFLFGSILPVLTLWLNPFLPVLVTPLVPITPQCLMKSFIHVSSWPVFLWGNSNGNTFVEGFAVP